MSMHLNHRPHIERLKHKEQIVDTKNIVVLGIITHLLVLVSILNIYFVSPVDHGMVPHKSAANAPAKRLVLIVIDGLRSQSLYGPNITDNAPLLNKIILNSGSWGVSHTRVPTESRPGHAALLAGIYEDPSAILEGWKTNPVVFDSILNQSKNSWCWGSPDILNLFNKDELPHIRLHTYDPNLQDFSGHSSTIYLDEWVFKEVEVFFRNRKSCGELCDERNVFFLHLLGVDTAGHGFKPHSKQYIDNIKAVDDGINRTVHLFNNYFGDDQTVYVVTSDHGMTDWGSHGAGSDEETFTPIIAWGAGIARNPLQNDIKQINVAPLLSSLIGANIPVNSLGVVPLTYLNVTKEQEAAIIYSNMLQLLEQYHVKRSRVERNTLRFLYRPFEEITEEKLDARLKLIGNRNLDRKYEVVIDDCLELIGLVLAGIEYYYNYDRIKLLMSISIGFVGWITLLCISITFDDNRQTENSKKLQLKPIWGDLINVIFAALFCTVILLSIAHSYPLMYYVYFTFPVFMWYLVSKQLDLVLAALKRLRLNSMKTFLFSSFSYAVLVELLVLVFFKRWVLSLIMLLVALWLPVKIKLTKSETAQWMVSCAVLSAFPQINISKTHFSYSLFCASVVIWVLFIYWVITKKSLSLHKHDYMASSKRFRGDFATYLLMLQSFVLGIALCNVYTTTVSIEKEQGLPRINQLLSWFTLAFSLVSPVFAYKTMSLRFFSIIISLMSTYALMAVSYEGIFMAALAASLHFWVEIENRASESGKSYLSFRTINENDFRCAFIFLLFIIMGFFGTGNVASISTFDPMWVRCFLTIYSPFTMSSLILVKYVIPFLFVTCALHMINTTTGRRFKTVFGIVLLYSDLMVLNLMYMIKTEGSWLEIGSSFSNFIIMEVITLFLMVLHGIAVALMKNYNFRLFQNRKL